ncbi:MAG: ATPase AAA, partial [Parcubacteria group bacterium Gr01-1014_56]
IVRHVRGTSILIIDEISMLSANTLTMVEAVCREIRGNTRPFGGLQILLVGDFFQLPPVVSGAEASRNDQLIDGAGRGNSGFAFNSPAWKLLNPIICYLSEQHRQEDEKFLEILSAIRRGEVEEEHRELLLARRTSGKDTQASQLFSHNADVNEINDAELGKLEQSAHVFTMTARGSEGMVLALKRGCLSPEVLTLKVGARVMFTKNDIAAHSYVNGTLGVVTGFVKENGYPIVKTHNGRVLVVEPTEWRIEENGKTLARINQLPLRLAWAMTVHKSQGMSLDAAHMDLRGAFEYGQGYVALSRVRTLLGLSLGGLNERALEVHPEIKEQDQLFREQSEIARQTFARIPEAELIEMQENFVRASGGTVGGAAKKTSRLETIRGKHPNAYRSWSKEEDENLKERFLSGEVQKNIAKEFGRQPGAIRARLIKLGLIEE